MNKEKNLKRFPQQYIYLLGLGILIILGYVAFQWRSQPNTFGMGRDNRGIGMNQGLGANQVTKKNCLSDDCLTIQNLDYPVGELPTSVKTALDLAIEDEYKALSTYMAVLNKYGSVRPFSMIKGAEEQHIASLKSIYDKYGLTIPENKWLDNVKAPESLQNACQVGVDAEIANASLYREKLLPMVSDYEDITLVFTNLMNASQQKHLPAFERCK